MFYVFLIFLGLTSLSHHRRLHMAGAKSFGQKCGSTSGHRGLSWGPKRCWKGMKRGHVLYNLDGMLDVSTFFKISTAWSSEVYKWVWSHYFSFMIYIMLCSHMSEYSIGSTFSKSKRHHNHLFTNDKLLTETMPKWFHFRCWSLRLWSFPLECGFLGRIASLWPSEDRFENAGRSKAWDGRWSENRRRSAGSAD